MASSKNGTLYIGITNNVFKRATQHKEAKDNSSFVSRYGVNKLVYYEAYGDALVAIQREKRLKKWNRAWKLRLIEQMNPNWYDLVEHVDDLPSFVEFDKV